MKQELTKTIYVSLIGVLLLVASTWLSGNGQENSSPQTGDVNPGTVSRTARSNFLPGSGYLPVEGVDNPVVEGNDSQMPEENTERPGVGEADVQDTGSLAALKNLFISLPFGPSSGYTTAVLLPEVSDDEITITKNGASTKDEYIKMFMEGIGEISFDQERFNLVLRDESGLPVLPFELVRKVLRGEQVSESQQSLLIMKDFLGGMIAYTRTVPVSPSARDFAKRIMSLDLILQDVVSRAALLKEGDQAETTRIRDMVDTLQSEAGKEHEGILASVGLVREESVIESSWKRLGRILGINITANAQGANTPFGGPITHTTFCSCSFANGFIIGEPVPATLVASSYFFFTPAFFPYRRTQQAQWLGVANTTPVPCLQTGTPCTPDPVIAGGSLVLIVGTS